MLQQLYHRLSHSYLGRKLRNQFFLFRHRGSGGYWEQRYRRNGNSGAGSYGEAARYKAAFINDFVKQHRIRSITELGCGDGHQLSLFDFPSYVGIDVSPTAVQLCRTRFARDTTKQFVESVKTASGCSAELTLSLDVVYHLVEDNNFEWYMQQLFALASRFVVIYAWDVEAKQLEHVRHRRFTRWVTDHQPAWKLTAQVPAPAGSGFCDFFVYEKVDGHEPHSELDG